MTDVPIGISLLAVQEDRQDDWRHGVPGYRYLDVVYIPVPATGIREWYRYNATGRVGIKTNFFEM